MPPVYFETAADFRRWLERHHREAKELIVGFRKVGSGLPSLTWPEAVDEALCFGWIDGLRRRVDDTAYVIRFTPRQPGSVWSRVNVAKAERLVAEGRMHAAGLAAFEARRPEKTGIYSFERDRPAELSAAELRELRGNRAAWKYFEAVAPGYRKVVTHWIVSAKRAETRARRLAQLVAACAEGRRLFE